MRELRPGAIRSNSRKEHREFYARYMASPKWFARRERWALEEQRRSGKPGIRCRGGCGTVWGLNRGDLHHRSYEHLGNETHEDLWPLCRPCHTQLHQVLGSTRSWRKLPRQLANEQALAVVQARVLDDVEGRSPGRPNLRDFL